MRMAYLSYYKKRPSISTTESHLLPPVSVMLNGILGVDMYGMTLSMTWSESPEFFQKYPDDTINVYVKTENGFENLYEFYDGGVHDTEVIHYQIELNKVCEELNQRTSIDRLPLFEVIDIAQHPTILYHYGAYTFIGYNVFELYGDFSQHFELAISYGDSGRNYNNLPDRIKAQQILYDNLVERRKAGL